MLRYMPDTNLCIRVLRDRTKALRARFNAEASGLAISTIVLTELLDGAARVARQAAAHAADIAATLHATGQPIGAYDGPIAGHARSRGLIVVTGNLAEFSRVAGLRCEHWLAGGQP
jgi:tRNA(fMet)-specific endonuclease VapC